MTTPAGPSVSGQPTPEPGFEILEDRTVIGTEAWVFKCTACGQISSRYLDPIKAGGGAWEHLRRMHGLEDRPQPLPDSATVRAQLASLTAENARLRSQLAEAREQREEALSALRLIADKLDIAQAAPPALVADLTVRYVDGAAANLGAALANAEAAHDRLSTLSGIADGERELRAAQLERERDSLREERDRLVAEVRFFAEELAQLAGNETTSAGMLAGSASRRLRAAIAATTPPPAAPAEPPPVGEGAALIAATEAEINPDWEGTARILARVVDGRPAAPVQPEERPGHNVDCGSCCCCSIDTDRLRAALATAERQRDEARRSTALANEAGKYGTAIAKHIQDERDALRDKVQRIADWVFRMRSGDWAADSTQQEVHERLRAALGSTPDTGSTADGCICPPEHAHIACRLHGEFSPDTTGGQQP